MIFCKKILECNVSKRRARDIYHAEFTLIVLIITILRCVQYSVRSYTTYATRQRTFDDLIAQICIAAFWFHLLFAIALLNQLLQVNNRLNLQTGYWIIKGFLLGLGFAGCLLFPPGLTEIVVKVFTVCLVPYLIMQTYFLLLHIIKVNSGMINAFEQSDQVCGMPVAVLLVKAAIFLGLGLFLTIWSFLTVGNPGQCPLSVSFIVITCVLSFVIMVYSVTPWRPSQFGLLTSAAMFFYASFVQLTVIASTPDLQCNSMPSNIKLQIIAAICGYLILSCLIYRLKCDEDDNEYLYDGEQMMYKPILVHMAYGQTFAYLCIQLTVYDVSEFTMWNKQVGLCLSLIVYFCLLVKILKLQRLSIY
eukprot:TRINITY_DN573_c0_g1_i1.p1 TRINITY_DN573_c0_g1~~TRINITY_DN573_c0_g1_i1.p1  ORF type:complete len:361 (+),score=-15.02 TRINITY_DN573_c0_g1_i1:173-1255(+)